MSSFTMQMERTIVCSVQRQTVLSPRNMQMIAPRPVLKASTFTSAAKPMLSGHRSVKAMAASSMVGETELPAQYSWYETMIVLRPDMSDEERDQELAKFEAFLKKESAREVKVTVRGKQRLAYPIKRFSEGIYILYTYAAGPPVSQAVQKNLSTPEAGAELNILRHMTFRV